MKKRDLVHQSVCMSQPDFSAHLHSTNLASLRPQQQTIYTPFALIHCTWAPVHQADETETTTTHYFILSKLD